MKTKYINPTATGIITAIVIFVLAHLVLGKDGDGNLLVFGAPAVIGGLIVFFILRSIDRSRD